MPIHLAPDTARALKAGLKDCDSRSLWKDKFVFFDGKFDEAKQVALNLYASRGRDDIEELRDGSRGWTAVRDAQLRKQADSRRNNQRFNPEKLNDASYKLTATDPFLETAPAAVPRSRSWLTTLTAARVATFQMKAASRLLVGLANGVLENAGCSLHPLYGFGVIPGSALKAVARDAAKVLKIDDADFLRIFGNDPDEKIAFVQGSIAFLDAHAIVEPGQTDIEVDVVTPHFQDYYSGTGNREAFDAESPIPSAFPAIAAGVRFEFPLIAHTLRISDEQAKADLATAQRCLMQALSTSGVGAKTAAGYGRFEPETANPATRHDLFEPSATFVPPPPPPPVPRTAGEKVLAAWKGKTISTFQFGLVIRDLASIDDDAALAAVFDAIMPPAQLKNFRLANDYWKKFNHMPDDAGKKLLSRLNRPLT